MLNAEDGDGLTKRIRSSMKEVSWDKIEIEYSLYEGFFPINYIATIREITVRNFSGKHTYT